MKIKVGDNVKVMSGKDRGKTGKVLQVFPKVGKVVIEKMNIVKKHVRSGERGKPGQRLELPGPMPASRVQIICAKCNTITRVGYKGEKKEKHRICRKCKEQL